MALTQLEYPLFDFAFLAHVTTDRGLVNGVVFHASEPISTDQLSKERIIPEVPIQTTGLRSSHIHVTRVEVFRQFFGDWVEEQRKTALYMYLVIRLNKVESNSVGKGRLPSTPFQLIVCRIQ